MTGPEHWTPEQAFGEVVKAARTKLGWAQEKLADESGLHRTYVSQLERGLKSPTLGAMHKLAVALGRPLSELIEETYALMVSGRGHGEAPPAS